MLIGSDSKGELNCSTDLKANKLILALFVEWLFIKNNYNYFCDTFVTVNTTTIVTNYQRRVSTHLDKAPWSIDREKLLALRGESVGLQSFGADTAAKTILV